MCVCVQKSPDLWRFIEGLNWINPHMTASIGKHSNNETSNVCSPKSARIRNDTALLWLWDSLLTHQLESRLQCLLSDTEHLTNCYDVTTAFLCCPRFVGALNICLDAFKQNQYEILFKIEANLYGQKEHDSNTMHETAASIKSEPRKKDKRKRSIRMRYRLKHFLDLKLRPWASLPEIQWQMGSNDNPHELWSNSLDRRRGQLTELTKENLAIKNRYDESTTGSKSTKTTSASTTINQLQPISLLKCDNIKIHTDRRHAHNDRALSSLTFNPTTTAENNLLPFMNTMKNFNLSGAASTSMLNKSAVTSMSSDFTSLFATNGAKIDKSYVDDSFISDSNTSPNQESPKYLNDGCTLVPVRGQTLAAYLQEAQQIRRNITDLERENAHFSLSDVIISAIEEIKCNLTEQQKQMHGKQKQRTSNNKIKTWHRRNSCSVIGDKATKHKANDELSKIQSKMNICSNSTSETDLSHISSDSDTSEAGFTDNLDRLKVLCI